MRVGHKGIWCGAVASDIGPAARAPLGFGTMTGGEQSRNEDQLDLFVFLMATSL